MSPSPAHPPLPTPTGGIPAAPRGRRRDHLLASVVGALLAPALLTLSGVAAQFAAQGRLVLALLHLLLLLGTAAGALSLFAARSSLGGLVTALVALTAQVVVLLAPDGAADAPFAWARSLIPTGMMLIVVGLMLGGSWGMRRARRAGRAQARIDAQLAQADRAMGMTPAPPPSRRREHALSLPFTIACVLPALAILWDGYAPLVDDSAPSTSSVAGNLILVAPVLLIAASAATGFSSLGARAAGPLLALAALPAIVGPALGAMPGSGLLERLLPHDPTAITLAGTGLLLLAIGWGSHLARQQGRARQAAALRSAATEG